MAAVLIILMPVLVELSGVAHFTVTAGQTITIVVASGGDDGDGDASGQDGSVSLSWH